MTGKHSAHGMAGNEIARLIITYDGDKEIEMELPLVKGANVIGRSNEKKYQPFTLLEFLSVSRTHAAILIDDDESFLEDLGSMNGTRRKSRDAKCLTKGVRYELPHNSVVWFGDVCTRFEMINPRTSSGGESMLLTQEYFSVSADKGANAAANEAGKNDEENANNANDLIGSTVKKCSDNIYHQDFTLKSVKGKTKKGGKIDELKETEKPLENKKKGEKKSGEKEITKDSDKIQEERREEVDIETSESKLQKADEKRDYTASRRILSLLEEVASQETDKERDGLSGSQERSHVIVENFDANNRRVRNRESDKKKSNGDGDEEDTIFDAKEEETILFASGRKRRRAATPAEPPKETQQIIVPAEKKKTRLRRTLASLAPAPPVEAPADTRPASLGEPPAEIPSDTPSKVSSLPTENPTATSSPSMSNRADNPAETPADVCPPDSKIMEEKKSGEKIKWIKYSEIEILMSGMSTNEQTPLCEFAKKKKIHIIDKFDASYENQKCVLLITSKKIKRTPKIVMAIGVGIPILSVDDFLSMSRSHPDKISLPIIDQHILIDEEFDTKYNIRLAEVIMASRKRKIFDGCHFFLLKPTKTDIAPSMEELKQLITCCGGKIIEARSAKNIEKEKIFHIGGNGVKPSKISAETWIPYSKLLDAITCQNLEPFK